MPVKTKVDSDAWGCCSLQFLARNNDFSLCPTVLTLGYHHLTAKSLHPCGNGGLFQWKGGDTDYLRTMLSLQTKFKAVCIAMGRVGSLHFTSGPPRRFLWGKPKAGADCRYPRFSESPGLPSAPQDLCPTVAPGGLRAQMGGSGPGSWAAPPALCSYPQAGGAVSSHTSAISQGFPSLRDSGIPEPQLPPGSADGIRAEALY